MNFNGRYPHRSNCIPERNAGMGVSSSIENNHIKSPFCLLNPINQFSLHVGLSEINFYTQVFRAFTNLGFDVGQSRMAIHIGFTFSKQI